MSLLKSISAACVVLAATCCVPTTQTPHTYATADLERKTVALVEQGHVYCSGVWVSGDAILTAAHCMGRYDVGDTLGYITRGDVSAKDEDEIEALHAGKLAALDEDHDLALVRVKLAPEHAVAYVSSTEPTVGQVAQTEGHPLGLLWSYSAGNVAAVRLFDGVWYVQSTAPISPGNSGGGLFDEQGDLLGICHGHFTRGENLNLFVHAKYVTAFLKENL